jgi:hypothetical protein
MPLLYYQVSTLQDKEKQQEVPCGEEQEWLVRYQGSIHKCKRRNDWPRSEGWKKPKVPMNSLNQALFRKRSFYGIGPPSWINKVINSRIHGYHLLSTIISLLDKKPVMVSSCNHLKILLLNPNKWSLSILDFSQYLFISS